MKVVISVVLLLCLSSASATRFYHPKSQTNKCGTSSPQLPVTKIIPEMISRLEAKLERATGEKKAQLEKTLGELKALKTEEQMLAWIKQRKAAKLA